MNATENEVQDFLNNVFSIIFTENIANLDEMLLHATSEYEKIGRGVLIADVSSVYFAYQNKTEIQFTVPTIYLPASEIKEEEKEQSPILKKYLYGYCPSSDFIFIALIREGEGFRFKTYFFQSTEATNKLEELNNAIN